MSDKPTLDQLRQQIDAVDEEIQKLVNRRGKLAQDVASAKTQAGDDTEFYRPSREAQVLRKVMERNTGPISDEDMGRLFREIMSSCLALEQVLNIAYLGPAGTFTQAAALKHFGHSVQCTPLTSIDTVFREVVSKNANYGVVPIENSSEGVIDYTLDMFLRSPLKICGEVELRVHHNILSRHRSLDKIQRIYTHQQSLAQCREWLNSNLPHAEKLAVSSNAEGARRAAQEDGSAAIAGEIAAELYQLNIVSKNIEDEPDNTTRFIVIGPSSVPASGNDKTSLLVSTGNNPGALHRLLKPFSDHKISMTRIESRPSRALRWEYVFFIDIDGHVDDPAIANAIDEMKNTAAMLKILGSYPKAVL